MKKTFSKILMSVIMVGVFLLPVSPGIEIVNEKIIAKIEISKINAQTQEEQDQVNWYFTWKQIGTGTIVTQGPYTYAECIDASPNLMFAGGLNNPVLIYTDKTDCAQSGESQDGAKPGLKKAIPPDQDPDFGCWSLITDFPECLVEALYYIVFKPVAAIARLAARILDFFVYYSISSSAYTGGKDDFIGKAWGAVRDITNIFFIIALLYVAIKTILSLNVSDNKKLVGYIIVIALLINFSLFTTKVVIDASNILAKIFYNSIIPQDDNGKELPPEAEGEKSISVGLVKQFDPQEIITTEPKDDIGLFAFITLLSIAVMGYMIYMFLSVALLFVARVVGLWLSMIFSPIAFASYTVPFSIPEFGHKDWWPNLFKMAFLAPIFVFFLYIIILFGDFLKIIPYETTSTNWLDRAMHVIIPFAIVLILLMQAKKIAVTFSGEIGAAIMSAGKMVGGLAGGMALGAMAVGGRQILGRAGNALANNSTLKSWAANSKIMSGVQKGAMKLGSGSFDLRQAKVAGKSLGSVTGLDLGEGKKGGFKQAAEDRVKRRQKRAEELKVGEDEGLNQNVRRAEVAIAEAKAAAAPRLLQLNEGELDQNGHPINGIAGQGLGQLEREATRTERVLSDAERNLKDVIAQFGAQSQQANTARTAQATAITDRDTSRTNVNDRQALIRAAGGNTHHAQVSLQMAQNAVIAENRTRSNNFAARNNSVTSNVFTVLRGGSWKANREASNKIRAGVQQESSTAHH